MDESEQHTDVELGHRGVGLSELLTLAVHAVGVKLGDEPPLDGSVFVNRQNVTASLDYEGLAKKRAPPRGIRHLTTKPYRPRTNGKVERFHQTMAREWAYGLAHRSHHERNQALPHWLKHYNTSRPHSSIGDRPPISRVHNARG